MAKKKLTRDATNEQLADAPRTGSTEESTQQRIAERAYRFYTERGAEDGRALEDWLRAEREVQSEDS